MNEEQNGCEIKCDENGCRVECGDEVERVEEVASGCQPSVADVVRGTTYARVEDFEVALSKVAMAEQVNMSPNWKKIIGDMWENHQCCCCSTAMVRCPCGSIRLAKRPGGSCPCNLFLAPTE